MTTDRPFSGHQISSPVILVPIIFLTTFVAEDIIALGRR